jgi:hypothetical protein
MSVGSFVSKLWAAIIGITLICCPCLLYALPEGESVVAGSAFFDRSQENALSITTPSDKLIVNYNSFSIGAQQVVRFVQPSSDSVA